MFRAHRLLRRIQSIMQSQDIPPCPKSTTCSGAGVATNDPTNVNTTGNSNGTTTSTVQSKTLSTESAIKRRGRPPLSYTDDFETPQSMSFEPIGVVRSPYKERFGTPRQPNVAENTLGNTVQPARIHLYKHTNYQLSLRGLVDFEYCWVITFFHLNQGFSPLVTPPRGPRKKQGVFATRSPHRPNSIGLSCIRVTDVDEKEGIVHLLGVDLLDGTPVLDIKPYVPYCDAFPNAKAGWLDQLKEDMKAPDKLNYDPPPAHLMRPVSVPDSASTAAAAAAADKNTDENKG